MPAATQLFRRPLAGPATDRDLLRRFADARDDDAFAELVRRYGRLVFDTCLRVLSHRADAEDAYQASFLVLARRAAAVRSDERLAGWLHTVAVRTATEVRRMRDRRRQAEAAPSLTLPARTDPLESRELAAVLDEELAKLPDHYRLTVVLCELNGLGRKAAAKELGIAEGTLSSRLAKARTLLADRLASRGFGAAAAGPLTAAMASSAVSRVPAVAPNLLAQTPSAVVLSVSDTVVKALYATKLKAGALVAVLVALAGGAAWTTTAGTGPGAVPAPAKVKEPAKANADPVADVVARLGSKEFAEREAAEKQLRELGVKALPALHAGRTSDNPEVAQRCRRLLGAIHKDAREAFARDFLADTNRTKAFDHPVWKRFVSITGDSKASRAVFAELLKYKYPDGLEALDAADRDPSQADTIYRAHLSDLAKQVEPLLKMSFSIADMLPGHTADIAAYTLVLGSYRTTATPPETLKGEESYRYINGRNYIVAYGEGLKEGFAGKLASQGKDMKVGKLGRVVEAGPPGTDKVFARLYAHFLAAEPVPGGNWSTADPFAVVRANFDIPKLSAELLAEALPAARRVVADKAVPPLHRAIWVPILRRYGDNSDAVRLACLFDDKTALPNRGGQFSLDTTRVEVREWAVGTALVLRGKDPADFGFDRFTDKKRPERTAGEDSDWAPGKFAIAEPGGGLGFVGGPKERDPAAKEKALTAAIAWLDGDEKQEQPKKDDPAPALVGQLGSKDFAEREAAQKKLKELGAAAFAAVQVGLKSDNPEVVQRCKKLLPDVRAAWLARPESEVWKRFAAITGDTAHAKELFVEMAADPIRADALTADKPAERYEAILTRAIAELKKGYEEAERFAQGRTGLLSPTTGKLTRPEAALLFFLGTAADTGAFKPDIPENDRWLYSNMLGQALYTLRPEGRRFPAESTKLFAAWLAARRDPLTIRKGFEFARFHEIADTLPIARAALADDRLTLAERTPALFVVGQLGSKADLDRVRPFLDCETVHHETKYTGEDGKQFPVTTQVRDVAHAAAGKLLGAEPMDLGFEFCVLYKTREAAAFKDDYKLGFTTDEKRSKAHENVRKLLKTAPVPKDVGPAKPKKLPKAAPPSAELQAALTALGTGWKVATIEDTVATAATAFPAAEDRAQLYSAAAHLVTNGHLREEFARIRRLADKALELSRDPVLRWKVRSLQASTVYISGRPFAERRRGQADLLLAGYAELLVQDLPDADPEWPAAPGNRIGVGATPQEQADHAARQEAYRKAREQVEFTKELVFGRKVLLMQLRDAYKPRPGSREYTDEGLAELRELAAKTMTAGEVKTLVARVLDEK